MPKKRNKDITVPAPVIGERSPEADRAALKRKVKFFYDMQRLRLQTQGRLAERPNEMAIQLHPHDLEILQKRVAELLAVEKEMLKDITDHLKTLPFYTQVLSDKERYRGLGPTMAAVILSEFEIQRQDNPAKMWSFAGLSVDAAKRCKACHIFVVPTETGWAHQKINWKNKEKAPKCKEALTANDIYNSGAAPRPTPGEKLRYNAFLKSKLLGVLGSVLLQTKSPWRKFYYDYKARKTEQSWGISDGHRHNAAIRYMVKMLLQDIWREWRRYENLPIRPSYQEQYLGHLHVNAEGAPKEVFIHPSMEVNIPLAPEVQAEADLALS